MYGKTWDITVLFYATVVGLDASLYESASIDGANRWQKIVHITGRD